MSIQVDFGIACQVIGSLKNKIICQPDSFVGFIESPLKIPYCTDVNRGY